jgi:DNA-binding CsgD family transcriptional regulator
MALSFESAVSAPTQPKPRVELTERQLTVLRLICEGITTKDLAAQLKISVKTAEFHRGRLLNVFGVKNTVQLVRIAIRHGLIAP